MRAKMPAASLPRRRTYNITSSSLARQHAQDGISCCTRWHLVQRKIASYTCYPPYIGPDAKPQACRRRDCKTKERRYACTPPYCKAHLPICPPLFFITYFLQKTQIKTLVGWKKTVNFANGFTKWNCVF